MKSLLERESINYLIKLNESHDQERRGERVTEGVGKARHVNDGIL